MIDKAKSLVSGAKSRMNDAVKFLEEDLKTYRAGKANPLLFNNIMVDYYCSSLPVPQVASVTTPDAKTIAIQPWEKKMIPVIEKAIMDANVGMTPQNNGETIRCTVPPLTEERRKELIKKAKSAGENAKVVVRNVLAYEEAVDGGRCAEGRDVVVLHDLQQLRRLELSFVVVDEDTASGNHLSVELAPYGLSPASVC